MPKKRHGNEVANMHLSGAMALLTAIQIIVVSAPTVGEAADGTYTFPVMESLKKLMLEGRITLGYSWAGDSIPYKDTSGLQKKFMNASPDKREAAYQELRAEVMSGQWWQTYKGKLHGAITSAVQAGKSVILVGIMGGAITQLEQREMTQVIENAAISESRG